MALQIRRGTNANRLGLTPALGEPVYVTDYANSAVSPLFIGDGTTVGGKPVTTILTVNGQTGNVVLTTDTVAEGAHTQYFTTTRAQDAVGQMLAAGTLSGVAITYNSTTHTISISTTSLINTGTTGSIAYWAANGSSLTPTSNLNWNSSNSTLTNVNGAFIVQQNISGLYALSLEEYNNQTSINGDGQVFMRRARGTNITPTAATNTDYIYSLIWQAYDGNTFQQTASIAGSINGTVSTGITPGLLQFYCTDTTGNSQPRVSVSGTGVFTIGPAATTQTNSSGTLSIRQTTTAFNNPTVTIRNYANDAYGVIISSRKYRGTYATPTAVQPGDQIAVFSGRGYDGANLQTAGSVQLLVDGTVSAGVVPGQLAFFTHNSAGVETLAAKIDSTQQLTTYGNVTVNGNLTVNGTSITVNETTVNVEDKLMKLGYLTSSTVSTVGQVTLVSGTGPWTATISGMTSTVDLIAGSAITATGTGATGSVTLTAAAYSVASNTSATINFNVLTLSGTTTGTFAIGMLLSGGAISPNTYIIGGSGTVWTLSNSVNGIGSEVITGTLNLLTTSSTASLALGTKITIPSAFGGLSAGTTYYVSYIATSTQFSVSSTFNGANTTLGNATGSVVATTGAGSLGSGGTYIVASVVNSTSITITATGGTTPVTGPITTIATSGATDTTAVGGGIQVYGSTNKTFTWASTTAGWTSSEAITVSNSNGISVAGNLKYTGYQILSPNYITVSSTSTYALSTTTHLNILLVTAGSLTATLTMPTSPVDGQVCMISVQTTNVTLALTAGPTLSGSFVGAVTAPTTFEYVYRASNTTWYRIQ